MCVEDKLPSPRTCIRSMNENSNYQKKESARRRKSSAAAPRVSRSGDRSLMLLRALRSNFNQTKFNFDP